MTSCPFISRLFCPRIKDQDRKTGIGGSQLAKLVVNLLGCASPGLRMTPAKLLLPVPRTASAALPAGIST